MLEIIDVREECDDGITAERNRSRLNRIVIHRVGYDMQFGHILGDTAKKISDHFTGRNNEKPEVAEATGKENPYTFIIGGDCGDIQWDGSCWQVLPIDDVGRHARRWSSVALSISCIGDFRYKSPSPVQYESLKQLCAYLCPLLGIDPLGKDDHGVPYLAAHDELPFGSSNPNKRCPGYLLPVAKLRADVSATIKETAAGKLREFGAVV